MKEFEVKVLEIDKQKVLNKLQGKKKILDDEVISRIYDKPYEPMSKKDILRLRKKGEKNLLTFKSWISNDGAKICEEHEVEVGDIEETKKILELLGYVVIDEYHKHRTTYQVEETFVEIEELKGKYSFIPTFLEIEGKDIESIKATANKLQLEKLDTSGGYKLIRKYGKKTPGIVQSGMDRGGKFIEIYSKRLSEEFGFKPYPGTLNIKTDYNLESPHHFSGFEKEGKKFGALDYVHVMINGSVQGTLTRPVKSNHSKDILEVIAPISLRKKFGLQDGDEVEIVICEKR